MMDKRYVVAKANATAMAFVAREVKPRWIILDEKPTYQAALAIKDRLNLQQFGKTN